MAEPIFLVIERRPDGREFAQIVRDKLIGRIAAKNSPVVVYTLRIDKLPPDQQEFWLSKPCGELLDVYRWLKGEGTLPASNLADPPREKPRQGRELGNWWTPTPLPRGQDYNIARRHALGNPELAAVAHIPAPAATGEDQRRAHEIFEDAVCEAPESVFNDPDGNWAYHIGGEARWLSTPFKSATRSPRSGRQISRSPAAALHLEAMGADQRHFAGRRAAADRVSMHELVLLLLGALAGILFANTAVAIMLAIAEHIGEVF